MIKFLFGLVHENRSVIVEFCDTTTVAKLSKRKNRRKKNRSLPYDTERETLLIHNIQALKHSLTLKINEKDNVVDCTKLRATVMDDKVCSIVLPYGNLL